MNIDKYQKIKCHTCGKEYDREVIDVITASKNHELKQSIMSGDLFAFTCPFCRSVNFEPYETLYHDTNNQVVIKFVTDDLDALVEKYQENLKYLNKNDPETLEIFKGYDFRFVDDPYAFGEKVSIFDAGYDDRIIEIYKVIVGEAFKEQTSKDYTSIHFDYDMTNQKYVFLIENNSTLETTINFHNKTYNDLEKMCNGEFKHYDCNVVDIEWATNFLEKEYESDQSN